MNGDKVCLDPGASRLLPRRHCEQHFQLDGVSSKEVAQRVLVHSNLSQRVITSVEEIEYRLLRARSDVVAQIAEA